MKKLEDAVSDVFSIVFNKFKNKLKLVKNKQGLNFKAYASFFFYEIEI